MPSAGLPALSARPSWAGSEGGYRWQFLNGEAAQATTRRLPHPRGRYTAIANGTTSAPAFSWIRRPAGSGVWSFAAGGSWLGVELGGRTDRKVGAVADFSALALDADATVALNGRGRWAPWSLATPIVSGHRWTTGGCGRIPSLPREKGDPALRGGPCDRMDYGADFGQRRVSSKPTGVLVLTAASPFTGTVFVRDGVLEVRRVSRVPYSEPGATPKIGYGTGGGYAATGLPSARWSESPTGVYFAGGKNYNASGQIALLRAPTTLRQDWIGEFRGDLTTSIPAASAAAWPVAARAEHGREGCAWAAPGMCAAAQ